MRQALERIAKTAGSFFLKQSLTDVEQKEGHANFVTNIDCRVQAYLERALTRLLPGSRFIGEEKENAPLTDAPTWIVDPLDGTTNLIHGCRMSAVSIALCEGGQPVLGLVWQPYTREMFWAEKGGGAFLNGRPVRAARNPFSRALVAMGTSPYYGELRDQTMALAKEYLKACADIRRSGSAALDLAYLACGRLDVFFELRLKPWDYAAGSLLVTEAGGRICMPLNPSGMDYALSTAIFAATETCWDEALTLFRTVVSG